MVEKIAHGGPIIKIEREAAQLFENVLTKIANDPFADPCHAITAQVTDVTAECEESGEKKKEPNNLFFLQRPSGKRQPGIDRAGKLVPNDQQLLLEGGKFFIVLGGFGQKRLFFGENPVEQRFGRAEDRAVEKAENHTEQ